MKNAKIEPPTGSEDSRADKLKARRHPRPECRLDKQRFPDTIGPAGQPAEKNNPDALAGQPANQPAANPDMKARIDQPTKGQHWWDYEPTPSAASLDKIPVRLSGQPATRPPANPDTQTGQPVNQTPAKKNPDVPSGQPAERKSHEKLSGQPASRPVEKNPDALPVQPASRPAEDWRSALLAEFRNASREELLAVMEKNQCAVVGVNDPVVAKRILGQSVLMRTFGEPHGCNLGKPDEEAHALLREFLSNNIMESMLVVQMSGVHEAALAFLKAAGEPGLSQRQRDAEMRRAKQLMHLFNAQAAMMTKLKNQDWDRRGPAGRAPK